jgi:hypothetical protein
MRLDEPIDPSLRRLASLKPTDVKDRPTAEPEEPGADALSLIPGLVAALANVDNAVLHVGATLLVKSAEEGGSLQMLSLSSVEQSILKRNPKFLSNPTTILTNLARAVEEEQRLEEDAPARNGLQEGVYQVRSVS